MAEGLNRVMLLGNLGADPELRATTSGQSVLKLRLATTERYKDKSGVWQDRTEWHAVTVWGKRAEGLARFLSKGSRLFIEGSIHTSSYEKEGKKYYRTEINASNVILCDSKGGAKAERAESKPASTGSGGGYGYDDYGDTGNDDDIPF